MAIHADSLRQRAHAKADLIEAVASAYSGCRVKDGDQRLQRLIEALRR